MWSGKLTDETKINFSQNNKMIKEKHHMNKYKQWLCGKVMAFMEQGHQCLLTM